MKNEDQAVIWIIQMNTFCVLIENIYMYMQILVICSFLLQTPTVVDDENSFDLMSANEFVHESEVMYDG